MNELFQVVVATWLAGITAFVGGAVARVERIPEGETKQEIVHGIVAFGGGILVGAVAFVLAGEGIKYLSSPVLALVVCLGGICFAVLDSAITRRGGSRAQFMAMLMDFLPEAVSLGAVFGHDRKLGLLLAMFIGAQNLPEGFNAYRELKASGSRSSNVMKTLFAISFLGPVAGIIGLAFLQRKPVLTAGIMNFAAGGILYLVFQDIAPLSRMKRRRAPPLGAVLGFVVGMLGKKLLS